MHAKKCENIHIVVYLGALGGAFDDHTMTMGPSCFPPADGCNMKNPGNKMLDMGETTLGLNSIYLYKY